MSRLETETKSEHLFHIHPLTCVILSLHTRSHAIQCGSNDNIARLYAAITLAPAILVSTANAINATKLALGRRRDHALGRRRDQSRVQSGNAVAAVAAAKRSKLGMKPVALVTGANRGIGQEACKHLAKHGFTAILTSRDLAKGERVAAELQSAGLDIIYMPLDVTSAASIEQLAADVKAAFGRLDVLVNNAAVYLDEGVSVFDVPIDAFRVTFETNFYGPLLLCRAFMPLMIERH